MTSPSPWRIFAVVIGAILIGTLNFSLMFVAFSDLQESFGATESAVSWVLTAYSITLAAFLIPGGWLADRLGRKPIFLVGIALVTLGGLFIAVAPSIELLVAARVIQATGFAIENPAAFAILLNAFGPTRRSTAVGAIGAAGGVAAAFGPVLGGVLIGALGWRAAFAMNVPLGLIVLGVSIRYIPQMSSSTRTGPPDLIGSFALMAGIGLLAFGIVRGDAVGRTNPLILAAVVGAIALLATVVLRSRRHPSPIVDLPLLANRQFATGFTLSFLLGGSFAATFLTFVEFLQKAWGWSVVEAGLGVAVIPAIAGPASLISGRAADRVGHRAMILPGAVIMTGSAIWLHQALDYDADLWGTWIPATVVYSLGVGMTHTNSQAAAVATVPTPKLGIGSGMSRIAQEIGTTVGVAVVVTFLAHAEIEESLVGVRQAMIMLGVVSLLGAVLSATLPSRATFHAGEASRSEL